jgi:hypothetical protein
MPPSMWNSFVMSKAAAAINGGGSDRRQAAPRFFGFTCCQVFLRGRDDVDHVAAGRLRRRSLALLPFGLGVDQFFNVLRCKCHDIWRDLPQFLPNSPNWRRAARSSARAAPSWHEVFWFGPVRPSLAIRPGGLQRFRDTKTRSLGHNP